MRLCRPLLAVRPPDLWQFGVGHPRVAVLGGVHGNEITGVEVVRALVADFSHKDSVLKGQLTLAIGNPLAVAKHTRYVQEDLNRCFDGNSLETSDIIEEKRAAQLAPYLQNLDVLLDLHATNKPSTPFARLPGPVQGRRQRFQAADHLFLNFLPSSCQMVLWDPNELIAGGSMTDEFALRHAPEIPETGEGAPAYVCLESGQASDRSSVDGIYLAVRQCLCKLGMIGDQGIDGIESKISNLQRSWEHFEIIQKFSLDQRGFEWADGHGAYNFQLVPAGDVYGRRAKGEVEMRAPEGTESYMVFPKVHTLWAEGKPLGWLAKKLAATEL